MAALRAWLASGRRVAVRVLTGRAGAGKTRLSLELCEQMLAEGWAAGFVESEELGRFQDKQNLADWGWGRADADRDRLCRGACRSGCIAGSASSPTTAGDPEKPLRILLLERHAEAGSGWWQTAFGRGGFGARAVQKLLDPEAAGRAGAARRERRPAGGDRRDPGAGRERAAAAGGRRRSVVRPAAGGAGLGRRAVVPDDGGAAGQARPASATCWR